MKQLLSALEFMQSKNIVHRVSRTLFCPKEEFLRPILWLVFFGIFHFEGTVIQIEKALINDTLVFQKYPENFAFQLFIILQKFTRETCYFLKKKPTF